MSPPSREVRGVAEVLYGIQLRQPRPQPLADADERSSAERQPQGQIAAVDRGDDSVSATHGIPGLTAVDCLELLPCTVDHERIIIDRRRPLDRSVVEPGAKATRFNYYDVDAQVRDLERHGLCDAFEGELRACVGTEAGHGDHPGCTIVPER